MAEFVLAYVTLPTIEEARKLGTSLVEAKLAACVNFWEGMESIYWWEGKLETSHETVLIAKTRKDLGTKLTDFVKSHHSYSCPCVLILPVSEGNPDYLKWIETSL